MAVLVSFRPHRMHVVSRGGGSYDANGDWTESAEKIGKACIPCRYEPNGRAQTIRLQDGTEYKYTYTVYLDVCPKNAVEYGDIIELFSQDRKSIGRYEVKGFHRGQLDMKIWV